MKILCLDLSTNSTGFALFDSKNHDLLDYGAIFPSVSGISKMKYPQSSYHKIIDMANKIKDVVAEHNPSKIYIEEVNRGPRISQKTLDALHFFVLDRLLLLDDSWMDRIKFIDSNGKNGWRGKLGLALTLEDKLYNKEARIGNKKSKIKKQLVDWKVLAERFVNNYYNLEFDVWEHSEHADICDAIAIGLAVLKK